MIMENTIHKSDLNFSIIVREASGGLSGGLVN